MNTIEDYKRILMETQDECLRLTFENRELKQERDEALNAIHTYRCEVEAWELLSEARRERDEAREIAQQLINIASHCCGSDREDRWWLLLSRQVKEACDRFGAATQERRHVVPTEWAEQLERERDEARQKYDDLATEHMLAINKICNERDETRKQFVDFLNKTEDYKRERDEAREAMREIQAADWKTAGELRGMARKVLEAAK
jgi:hypothetical protein